MKINYFMTILLLTAMLTMIVPNSNASLSDSARLNVVLQSYEPFPAQPGSYVTLKFRATNVGTKSASSAVFELDPSYPFSIDPNEQLRRSYGQLLPGQSVVFEYKVRVDENAVLGNNRLRLKYSTDGTNWVIDDLEILVRLTESVLSLSSVSTSPELLKPGDVSTVKIDVSNFGASALRDISVKLNLDSSADSSPAGSALTSLPFAPVDSTSEKRIRLLSGGQTETLEFNLVTYPNADSRIYRVPITLSYTDELGETIVRSDVIGLVVGSEPRVSVAVSNVDLRPGRADVSLRFVNRGTIDLKFFNVKVRDSNEFNLLSPSDEYYIGRLSSDDFDIASFVVSLNPEVSSINLPLTIEYMDANNREFNEDIDLMIDVNSIRELNSANGNGGNGVILIVAIVLLVGFIIYKKRKKKKRLSR